VTVGNPAIKLGDAIELKSLEDTNLNKTYQVRAVTHRITKREGFTTEVGFCAI
jgi:phage protein D